jgi:hypothetical protein
MERQLNLITRQELIRAVGKRYRTATQEQKTEILNEFVQVTQYHRKYALQLLGQDPDRVEAKQPRIGRRIYQEAVREALTLLWEASDRLCGKRLKPLLPVLVEAMEQHDHLHLDPLVREQVLTVSAATIDRLLCPVRERTQGTQQRRGVATALRKSIPVRTFADWNDPAPGYMEADLVVHGGGSMAGSIVHSFVLTDVATGWTECIALPARDQHLIVEAIERVRARLPFPLRGFDTDNDSAFINETVLDYCRRTGIEFTRSRAYRKNDQAWVEQKNGAVVRKLIGYGRLSGMKAAETLSSLYEVSRCYVNFFQPSFKLKSKTRVGAKVTKQYHAPATPYSRLLASDQIPESIKQQLQTAFAALDPVQLLQQIRFRQQELVAAEERPSAEPSSGCTTEAFLQNLRTAWQEGEVRPTHQKRKRAPRTWRTRPDVFAAVWPRLLEQLQASPEACAKDLFQQLQNGHPGVFPDSQLRTLQRRVKQWRSEIARQLIMSSEETLLPVFAISAQTTSVQD